MKKTAFVRTKLSFFLLFVLFMANRAYSSDSILFLEGQMVAGYSSLQDKIIYYSIDSDHAEQKPSLGINLSKRYTNSHGDWGGLSFQGRVAHDDANDSHTETQIFDAYFDYKFWFADMWVGHNKPAYGLNTILDTHSALLQTLTAEGIGFERDWGAGLYSTYGEGDISISFTSGSGYMIYYDGNYLINTRLSYGILDKDKYTVGLSFANGQIFDMIDYHRLSSNLYPTTSAGTDFSWNLNRFEFKFEASIGTMGEYDINGTLLRIGYNLTPKNKLKLEVQPVLSRTIQEGPTCKVYSGISWALTDYLALRAMFEYNNFTNDHMVITQVYFNRRV